MNLSANRRCWAEISLSALCHNLEEVRKATLPQTAVLAVLKANAYGHGAEVIAGEIADKVEGFGTANVWEALELRKVAPKVPIIILGPALPEEREIVAEQRFVPIISNITEAKAYSDLILRKGWPRIDVHLAVDTGMGRLGVWYDEVLSLVEEIRSHYPEIRIAGVGTHLPVADEDPQWTEEELREWHKVMDLLKGDDIVFHALHSAGVLLHGIGGYGSLVRPGLMLYGCSPVPEYQKRLKPVLSWKTRVTLIRDVPAGRGVSYGRTFITPHRMKIATLSVGYADGFPRSLSGRGAEVLIQGKRCGVLGRVTMDQIMVDVTALDAVEVGEEVVLLGDQGGERILVSEMAQKAGTIPWEIFTGLGNRVQRLYLS